VLLISQGPTRPRGEGHSAFIVEKISGFKVAQKLDKRAFLAQHQRRVCCSKIARVPAANRVGGRERRRILVMSGSAGATSSR